MGLSSPGKDNYATGFSVETMDGPNVPVICFQDLRKVRSLGLIPVRNGKQPGRFVDNDETVIFMNNIF